MTFNKFEYELYDFFLVLNSEIIHQLHKPINEIQKSNRF